MNQAGRMLLRQPRGGAIMHSAPQRLPLVLGTTGIHTREMSSYVLDGLMGRRGGGGGGSAWHWPVTKPNTIFNIVPQGHK